MKCLQGACPLVIAALWVSVVNGQFFKQTCGAEDFKCDDNKCIESFRKCNHVYDCSNGEDERDCPCLSEEFKCVVDGECIEARKRCDGVSNCRDGSDEYNCRGEVEEPPCAAGQVSCSAGAVRCAVRCDGYSECDNGEDEYDCGGATDEGVCPAGSFKCDSGSVQCATRCDGINECENAEDEFDCGGCPHECDGICLEEKKICDGRWDCTDGSDEDACDNCDGPEDFRCKSDGECISARLRCNNSPECKDGSDELNCNETLIPSQKGCLENQVRCRDGQCINADFLCDGNPDCLDESDEENCPCRDDQYRCLSGECIALYLKCSGTPDCADGSDETDPDCVFSTTYLPPVITSPNPDISASEKPRPTPPERIACRDDEFLCLSGECIPSYLKCSGTRECADGSDEYNCVASTVGPVTTACRDDEFLCLSGECIPSYLKCSGTRECADGSDEYNCVASTERPVTTITPSVVTDYPTEGPSRDPWARPPTPDGQDNNNIPPYEVPTTPRRPTYDGPNSPTALDLEIWPPQQTMRYASVGGDVVFRCRDKGPIRAPVRWVREGGKAMKRGTKDHGGRLELERVTIADSGVYICQIPSYLGRPGSEKRVTLTVQNNITPKPPPPHCNPYEATCGNGDCIPKSAVCDGKYDCSDKTDEDMCPSSGRCEPNQFQCDNRKCVLKTWLCDSQDDCGDGSDERSCGPAPPGQPCLPSEFTCAEGSQCVPKSFHCDGRPDCLDNSDELGCSPVYIVKSPSPANLRLNVGDTLILRAEARGTPTPVISWRLNWGHVPAQCTSTSENGVGVLTCPNMQPEHSGAYSAEALNNRGTTFATPDAIVFVSQISPCPPGYFNNEARSEKECIRCFCFGESTQCHSADLFTYNMPTPLGQGGTQLLGVTITPSGEIRTDPSISNHYYYHPLRNGATVTKLASFDGGSLGSFHPYLSLPETYNGQQLTSYGGHIKYSLAPHSRASDFDSSAPTVIIKGKYATLFHFHRGRDFASEIPVEVRLTPEYWQKPGQAGFENSAREDIMMALDQVDKILLRADLNNGGVNISNFVMESAQHINVGLGAASLVEECTCPPGYEGLSCQKCSTGYVREMSGPWLGNCVREPCPPGFYGDPASNQACKPCPCPLTNRENQFARTCSLGADGNVACDCFPGYEGTKCDRCAPGFEGNPLVYGDTCRPRVEEQCNPAGTAATRLLGECVCKNNVQGRYCDQCKNDSFYLSNDFSHGCALCFCSGVSHQCMSSNLRRKTTTVNFNVPNIVSQVNVYSSTLAGSRSEARVYGVATPSELQPLLTSGGLTIRGYDRSGSTALYWSLPVSFTGDKVTSYGGYLRYTLENVPSNVRSRYSTAADVQLISDNHLTFLYTGNFVPTEGVLNVSVQFLENGWHRLDGKEYSREQFLLALADVKAILIKATYGESVATPLVASIETAEPDGRGLAALHVEQCVCPTGYVGTSCEDCAPGYTRSSSGLYLAHCGLCDCSGHSRQCHPETGECFNCMDNTDGPNCEFCKPGFERDGYDNCVAVGGDYSTSAPCQCDPRGSVGPCDASGRCECKANVEGHSCDRCRAGTFGLEARNPDGCIACFCSGATQECQEATYYTRIPLAAPIIGDDYGGYTLTDLNAENVFNDAFVPEFDKSELMYMFSFPPNEELYWSLPVFPGNRVTSYGGTLSLRQEFQSNSYGATSEPGVDVVLVGDMFSLYWTNPNILRSKESLSYQVPLREQGWHRLGSTVPASRSDFMRVLKSLRRVLVRATVAADLLSTSIADVSMDTATEIAQPGAQAALGVEICTCPTGHLGTSCESCAAGYYKNEQDYCTQCPCSGHDCQLDSYGQLTCNCRPPYTGRDCATIAGESQGTSTSARPPPVPSTVTVRILNRDIKIHEVGSSVSFTCQARSRVQSTPLQISWSKEDGYLPQGRSYADPYSGELRITNLQLSDSGVYVCRSSDGVSTGSDSTTLVVPANSMTVPSVSVEPPVADYYEGERVELRCVATGNPKPDVQWRRASNRPLPLGVQLLDDRIIIETAREEDSGEYSCVAQNTAGVDENVAVIRVRPRPSRPVRERLTVTPQAPSVREGQSTHVVCTATSSVPTGTIDWVRQDNTHFQSNVRSDNGVLYIDAATAANQGVYICRTHAADVEPYPVLVTVVPLFVPPGARSNISVSALNLTVAAGDTGTIDCIPSGDPLPRVNWTKYQSQFGPGVSQRGNTLIVNDALESDAGYYVCKGFVDGNPRPVGIIYVNVEIERREAPRVQILPEGAQPVPLGSTFEFQCRVLAGAPEPDLVWSRAGGRELSRDTHIMTNNILRFDRVDVNDEGEYICSGSSVAGSASASAALQVRAPPEISITPTNYHSVRLGEPLHMECRASGYPRPVVTIRGPDRRDLAPPSEGIATIRVASAGERDDGDYTCLATNAAGSREEVFVVRVYRGDAFPDFGGSGDNEIDPGTSDPNASPYDPNPPPYDPYDPNAGGDQSVNRPTELPVAEGDKRIEINCSSSAYDARWDRSDQQPLQRNAVQEGNSLVIYNVSRADTGEYVCSMYNSKTGYVQVARYIRLLVLPAPRITLRPETQTVNPGMTATVECIVEGEDIRSVRWQPKNRNPSRRVEYRNTTLIFHQIEAEDAGEYECSAENSLVTVRKTAEVIVEDATVALVSIDTSRTQFLTGENVQVSCRALTRDVDVKWEKLGTNQYVESRFYGDGAMLIIPGVTGADAGVYRCTGTDRFGKRSFQNLNLQVQPGAAPGGDSARYQVARYTARLRDSVEMPCTHDLYGPVNINWRRDYAPMQAYTRSDQPILFLNEVTEADAGTYVCRVSNGQVAVESRAVLRVVGVVPKLSGDGWLALPTIADAYRQFDIEVSFKPADPNGLILYNSQKQGRDAGDFLALQLEDGWPQFILETGNGPVYVKGDRPLALNTWHTIRLNRIGSQISMDVDNNGPFRNTTTDDWVLELHQPLYVGGVPDLANLPPQLAGASGFLGCVSMLIVGRDEMNIMIRNLDRSNVGECDSCSPNFCQNDGVCQEARNERGFTCICSNGFAGETCARRGEACHQGLCGPGRCHDTADGYTCSCPLERTGKNCEIAQSVEYPAFTGSGYLALEPPEGRRFFMMSLKIKPTSPVQDGIIMYCAESQRGLGGFTSLAIRNQRIEFRYDLDDGNPMVLVSNSSVPARQWTEVKITRSGAVFSLTINAVHTYEQRRDSANKSLVFNTAMFVGGVDEKITLNNNTGVTGGFSGCIKDVEFQGKATDIAKSHNYSGNVQDCNMIDNKADRGDIPEENPCQCRNGGTCNPDGSCSCPAGLTGHYCEARRRPGPGPNPCAAQPCKNGGTCRSDYSNMMNHSCECPLGYSGANCQMELQLYQSVSFKGDGYLELPAALMSYEGEEEPPTIALAIMTTQNGALFYQTDSALDDYGAADVGDYVLLRIDRGYVVLDWDMGSGPNILNVTKFVTDGERHQIIVRFLSDNKVTLTVDDVTEEAFTNGLANRLNVDSNIYIGGIPEHMNSRGVPGLAGCVEQVELMNARRALKLGQNAIGGKNTHLCRQSGR